MIIKNSTLNDLESILKLYRQASGFQKSINAVAIWPEFEIELVETEINEQRQYKLVINNTIACIWAVTFSDTQIWEGSTNDKAIYIHRIATNPDFRGQDFVSKIVHWAKGFTAKNNIDYIRLDTMGKNEKLIEVYKNSGFNFLGFFTLTNTKGLPEHYQNAIACLFEIKMN